MSRTIFFLGATGGVTNACLTAALKSGQYNAIALVRTPEKLRNQLITQQGLDEATITKRLKIVQGNAVEIADVKKGILTNITAGSDQTLPSMIVTGLGAVGSLQFNIWRPWQIVKIDNLNICGDAAKTLTTALGEIYAEYGELASQKPKLTFVSTTGITRGPEDVPFSMRFLYHAILAQPHIDKKKMEDTYRDQMLASNSVFSSVTGIRPTLLMGTGALSEAQKKVRAGVESKPETGFTIQRADVGLWMYENVIEGNGERTWEGEMVSLTA